jgi:tripartite-type tricarboxylate transporter receptor subunit TctC
MQNPRIARAGLKRLALAMAALALSGAAAAAEYPARPITMVVPYPPGGGADTLARIVAQKLGQRLRQTVIVENKPGANTIIATEYAARQPADGYTLLYVASSYAINPSLYKLNYDTEKAFAPIGLIAQVPLMLVTTKSLPANNVQELIALARQNPGKLSFASYGTGSPAHLAGELFKSMAKVNIMHVPYKGSSQALSDMMGGHVSISFSSMPPALSLVKAGELKALAVTTRQRVKAAPDLPTISESGVPGFEAAGWNGLVAPAGTPTDIVEKLNHTVNDIVADPAVEKQLIDEGYEPQTMSPSAFGTMISTEIAKWQKVIKDGNITVQ